MMREEQNHARTTDEAESTEAAEWSGKNEAAWPQQRPALRETQQSTGLKTPCETVQQNRRPARPESEKAFLTRQQERLAARQKRIARKKKIQKGALLAGGAACALLVLILLALAFSGSKEPEVLGPSAAGPQIVAVGGIPVVASILPEEAPGRPGELMRIKYIVIHETGNTGRNANAQSHNNYIHTAALESRLSWHYTVDDSEIYQHLPDNEMGFHAGDTRAEDGGNRNGIGVEMCVNPENDFEKTLENTAALVSYLIEVYGLTIEDVKMHQHFSGKECPETLIKDGRWDEFLEMVQNAEPEIR